MGRQATDTGAEVEEAPSYTLKEKGCNQAPVRKTARLKASFQITSETRLKAALKSTKFFKTEHG